MPTVKNYAQAPAPADATEPAETLTEQQQEMYKNVLAHFTKEGYVLPKEEKGELIEEEKFWLVSIRTPDRI
jgi:hypothetical protein